MGALLLALAAGVVLAVVAWAAAHVRGAGRAVSARRLSPVVRLAAAAAVTAVFSLGTGPEARAGYASPTLAVSRAGATVVITAKVRADDDATAQLTLHPPPAAAVATAHAAGTLLGSARLLTSARDLGGALMPFTGTVVAADPQAVPEGPRAACLDGQPPAATWLLELRAVGHTMVLPAFVLAQPAPEGAPPAAAIVVCTRPPDAPLGGWERSTFGSTLVSLQLALGGVVTSPASGTWLGVWRPWEVATGRMSPTSVATPASVAPGAVTIAARRKGDVTVVTGLVTQAGEPRGAAKVEILAGDARAALRKLATVAVRRDGSFRARLRPHAFFRARVVASAVAAPALCTTGAPLPAPCANATVGGFTAISRLAGGA